MIASTSSSPAPIPTARAWPCIRSRTRSSRAPSEVRPRSLRRIRPQIKAKGLAGQTGSRRPLSYSAPAEDGSVTTAGKTASNADDPYADVGRNAPCPCGSGKKFKMCHGRPGAA